MFPRETFCPIRCTIPSSSPSWSTRSMLDGKKGVAQKVVYGAFDIVREKTDREPLEVFTEAMENIMPSLEVDCKARRVGGATYQVPMEVRSGRRQTLGLRWITKSLALALRRPCAHAWLARFSMQLTIWAALSRSVRTRTRWQRRTRHSLTTVTN